MKTYELIKTNEKQSKLTKTKESSENRRTAKKNTILVLHKSFESNERVKENSKHQYSLIENHPRSLYKAEQE